MSWWCHLLLLISGLFGDPVKRKSVVGDKVGKEKYLYILCGMSDKNKYLSFDFVPLLRPTDLEEVCEVCFIYFLNSQCGPNICTLLGADGWNPFPVCWVRLKEVSRTWQDSSNGTAFSCKKGLRYSVSFVTAYIRLS